MIVPDTNLLVFAYDQTSPHHHQARSWWEHCLNGREAVGIPEVVCMAFVRLGTHPTLHENPMDIEQATGIVRRWFDCPRVTALWGRETTLPRAWNLLEQAGRGGNLTTDAWVAALTVEADAVLHTHDAGFAIFSGLRWKNPIKK